ncbi:MAG: hypothetical protein ABH877_04695, partial [bacterium]
GEAIAAHPSDALSQDCWTRVTRVTEYEEAADRAFATVGRYLAVGDGPRARAAVETFPPGCGADPRFLGAREAVERFHATVADITAPPLPSPLPPAPWVRWVGSWALGAGASSVGLAGRVTEEDLKGLRDAVPEIEWVLAEAESDRTFDVVVDVDVYHTAARRSGSSVAGRLADVSVFPVPEVPDPARCRAPDIDETFEFSATLPSCVLSDLRTVSSPRPGSGPSRIVRVRRRGGRPERELTIAAPHWLEPWGPDSVVEEGCGGSEEAAIYLSAALARRGVGVTVYGPYKPVGGVEVRDGVTWRPWETFRADAVRGPLVAHRSPELLRIPEVRGLSEGVWCWHHDHAYPEPTRWSEMAREAKGHLLVSNWQRGSLEGEAGYGLENPVVIGNGVPREDYTGGAAALPRDPRRVIYLSQPQRGLLGLLGMWPRILELEPEAMLYLYYGWATAEMLARTVASDVGEVLEQIGEHLRKTQRVKMLRRVPQKRLAQEMRQAGVWAYPTEYPEVSCIAGLRAAAAGCALVYRGTAALPETMADDRYAVGPEEFTEELFVSRVVTAMRDNQYPRDEIASAVLERDSWDAVAGRLVAGMFGE